MNDRLNDICQAVKERFGVDSSEFRDQVSLLVPPESIVKMCQVLRDEFGFARLASETAVDYWPQQDPRFHVVYQLHSFQHNDRICLRVPVPGSKPFVPTLVTVYLNANWYEREIWDMFGIRFEGHPDMRRILMPEDWDGHPLRKDYPLGYEEVEFTFNFEKIDLRKPRPKE